MYPSNPRPKWWQLYLTFPLLIALFLLDSHLRLSQRGHMAVQIGILLLVYGLIYFWLEANATALSRTDQGQYHGTIRVIRLPLAGLPEASNDREPMFQLPDSEIKGVLSDTFELDYIDAEVLPADVVSE